MAKSSLARLGLALGAVTGLAACSTGSSTSATSGAAQTDDGRALEARARPEVGSHRRACESPGFSVCSDAQVVSLLRAMSVGHGWGGAPTETTEAVSMRLSADWDRIRGEVDELVAREGIAPERSSYGDALEDRRSSFTDGGAFTGGTRPTRWFLGYETLVAFQSLGLIDHLLLPSARSHGLVLLLRDARATVASQVAMLLDAERRAFGACGAGGAVPRSGCALGEVCGPPAFAECADSQIRSILVAQLDSSRHLADTIAKVPFDPQVAATAARITSDAQRLLGVVRATPPPAGEPIEVDFSSVIVRTAVFEQSFWLIHDRPELAQDLRFLRYELLDRFQTLGLIDHLLLPSTPTPALAAELKGVRDTSALEVDLLVRADDALEGTCGGTAEPPSPADAGTDADAADGDAGTCPKEHGDGGHIP